MASIVSGIIEQVKIGSDPNNAIASTAYGVCETAAATAAKTVDMTGFTLVTGVTVHIKFTYSNTVASPTLNINSTGAKAIENYGTTATGTAAVTSWPAGAVVSFTYDGTNWIKNSGQFQDNNTDTKNTAGTTNTTSKIYLAGATSQAENPTTYSNVNVHTESSNLHASTFSNTSTTGVVDCGTW